MDDDTEQLDWGDVRDDEDAVMRDDDAISLGGAEDDFEALQKYQAAKGVEADSPTAANGSGPKSKDVAAAAPARSHAPPTLPQPSAHKERAPQKPTDYPDSRTDSSRQRAPGQRSSSPRQSSAASSSRPQRRPQIKHMMTPTGPLALPPKPTSSVAEPFLPPSHPSLTEASTMAVRGQRNGVATSRTHVEMLRGLSSEWIIQTSSQGSEYYYNTVTHETQWERPVVVVDTGKHRDARPPARPSADSFHEPASNYPRSESRRYPDDAPPLPPPPPRGDDAAASWTAASSGGRRPPPDDRDIRRSSQHYSPEQTRLPLAPRSRSPPPPPPPVRTSRRSPTPPRPAPRAPELGNSSWRPTSENDRKWRPSAEDERRWEERERERGRDRERGRAQEPSSKDRRPRARSAENASKRSSRKDDANNAGVSATAAAPRRRSPPPPSTATTTPNDDNRTLVSKSSAQARSTSPSSSSHDQAYIRREREPQRKRTLDPVAERPSSPPRPPPPPPPPVVVQEPDAKRRRTDSDPDSTRARRVTPDDPAYDASKDSPRKRKPLPPQDELLREAKLRSPAAQISPRPPQEQPQGPPPAPTQADMKTDEHPGSTVQQPRPPPSGPAAHRDRPPQARASNERPRSSSFRGEQTAPPFGDRGDRQDERVPSGPRADREGGNQQRQPPPPPPFRSRRDSVSRRSDEQQRSPMDTNGRPPLPLPHGDVGEGPPPPTHPRHGTRFGPPRSPPTTGDWKEQQQFAPPPNRDMAGRPSRFSEVPVPQLDKGAPPFVPNPPSFPPNPLQSAPNPPRFAPNHARATGSNEVPPRQPSFNQSQQSVALLPLPSPSVPSVPRLEERMQAPPAPIPVASQQGFYQNRGPRPPSRSPHVSPVQERNVPLPLPPVQQRPPLASRMSGPDYQPHEPPPQTQNNWGARGGRSRSFRSDGGPEGMQRHRSRSASPPRQFEQSSSSLSLHARFQFSERAHAPEPHAQPLVNGMHPDRMALVQAPPGPSRNNLPIPPPFFDRGSPGKQRAPRADPQGFHDAPPLSRKGSLLERLSDPSEQSAAGPPGGGWGGDGDVNMEDADQGSYRRGGRMNGPHNGRFPRRGQGRRPVR